MHNILLADGTQTRPGEPILAETEEVKKMIARLKQDFPNKKPIVYDLGCGEGGYGLEVAKAGFPVVFIDIRSENLERCKFASKCVIGNDGQRLSVDFLGCAADEFLNYGLIEPNSIIMCLGLLYHLPRPIQTLIALCLKTDYLILGTHYALEKYWVYDTHPIVSWIAKRICKRLPLLFKYQALGLSRLAIEQGNLGRWYPEFNMKRGPNGLPKSSYVNPKSFWMTRASIMEILSDKFAPHPVEIIREEEYTQRFAAIFTIK